MDKSMMKFATWLVTYVTAYHAARTTPHVDDRGDKFDNSQKHASNEAGSAAHRATEELEHYHAGTTKAVY